MKRHGLIWLGIGLLAVACHGKPAGSEAEVHQVNISEIPKDIKVPLEMWDVLAGGAQEAATPKKEGEGGEAAPADDSYVFADVKIILKEKNPGIIKNEEVEIQFPRGGGQVDLADYVLDQRGSYYVKFEFPSFDEAKARKVIFISHSRKRRLGDQIFGSGCHEFFDITDRFLKEMKGEGLKVNTTRARDVSVLSGSFILMAKKDGQSYITQVTFTDSGHTDLLCPVQP